MSRGTIDDFCTQVCRCVRFWPDHKAITAELTAHLEDHAAALEARGFPSDIAVQQAVDAMGDPEEIGKELDKSHSPFLGWFQIWFRAAVWTLLLLSILTAAYSLLHRPPPSASPPRRRRSGFRRTGAFPRWRESWSPRRCTRGRTTASPWST